MNLGKFVLAQVMEHLPLHAFHRCVARSSGEHKVKRFSCLDQYLSLAFGTTDLSREPARHRSVSVCAKSDQKLYRLGFWDFAASCAQHAGQYQRDTGLAYLLRLRAKPDRHSPATLGQRGTRRLDLKDTVYALDTTTIDLCLSVFPWAPFRSTKAAIEIHTLLDLRGKSRPGQPSPSLS